TLPTAGLARRGARLLETVAETAGPDDVLHLVGHSTGGVDTRVFTAPETVLPSPLELEPYAARVASAVSIAAPHHGVPQARLFTTLLGQHLLRALSLMTVHGIRLGSVPAPLLLTLAASVRRLTRFQGPAVGIVNQVYRQLLRDFDRERQIQLEEFFAAAAADQGLLPELYPEAMAVFNARVGRRESTRYGSVITRSRPPTWRTTLSLGLSPSEHAKHALYRALYELASTLPRSACPPLTHAQARALDAVYGHIPDTSANDAIVPTLSQVDGEILFAAWADHHDVIGQFDEPAHQPPHVDWLATQSFFTRSQFEALWETVAMFLIRA
ncbi:MAG TPA: hypothetical protein VML75_27900, partial [Kofleriaceae bacterium]|nr:hypothetical protein [Kofleriaceae bacterium]